MTFGSKLKAARQKACLSQEQFAEKLNVSRSAVAKWETDKGLPDVENLKTISTLLDISINNLLDDDETLSFQAMKEKIDLNKYEKIGRCRTKKDAVVLKKFPNAENIYPLIREKRLSKIENLLEWTVIPTFGLFTLVDMINNNDECYLVETSDKQYLVSVSNEFVVTNELPTKIYEKKFIIGNNKFTKMPYRLID